MQLNECLVSLMCPPTGGRWPHVCACGHTNGSRKNGDWRK